MSWLVGYEADMTSVDVYPIRPIAEDEFPAFYGVGDQAFNLAWTAESAISHELAVFEFDRSLAAFDGRLLVGTACVYSFEMTVPGAAVPVAGVSSVSVLPSHRRRGILSRLMRRQLADIRERGEAVAALFATETGIYGRFGYGLASWHARFMIRRGEGILSGPSRHAPADPDVRLRIAEPEAARTDLAKVYDATLASRPGMIARDDRWWQSRLLDPEGWRQGATALRCLIAEDGAGPRGYALFSVNADWAEHHLPAGTLSVREVIAADSAATAAIWADLLSRDLVAEVQARIRPVDDPLLHLLADSRRARTQITDALYVRLVDVGRALAQRRYACPVDAVIEVTDELCPWNQGRWRLTTSVAAQGGPGDAPGGLAAVCERTTDDPDVALDSRTLGAAYLGGTRLGALSAAGQVTELRQGALAALSAAMSWDPAPWCPMIF